MVGGVLALVVTTVLNGLPGLQRQVVHSVQNTHRWLKHGPPHLSQGTGAVLSEWKRTGDLAFLSEVSSVPLQQMLRHQHTAFANFFAGRAKYPRFKNRNSRQSAHYTRSAFRIRNGNVHLAKTAVPLAFVWSWSDVELSVLNPTMVVVSRDPDGRWFVTFCVDAGDPEPQPETGHAVGVDLGVKDFTVTSGGARIANPKHLDRKIRNLARYQRQMARKQRGSANRRKAKAKVARAHRKVRNARADFLHRTSTNLVRSADVIALEDLNVAGMARSAPGTIDLPGRNVKAKAGLNRSIRDAALGEFCRQVGYKAERAGKTLIVLDRWYPSSKTCSHCGVPLSAVLPLAESRPTRNGGMVFLPARIAPCGARSAAETCIRLRGTGYDHEQDRAMARQQSGNCEKKR